MRRGIWVVAVAVFVVLAWSALRVARPGRASPRERDEGSSVAASALSGILGGANTEGFQRATQVIEFDFPADHAAHETIMTFDGIDKFCRREHGRSPQQMAG